MQILKVTLIRQYHGMDQVVLHTDIADAVYPNTEMFLVLGFVPRGDGEKFIKEHFDGLPLETVIMNCGK